MSFTGNLTSTVHLRRAAGSSLAEESVALLRLWAQSRHPMYGATHMPHSMPYRWNKPLEAR
jgi:hypothetical protein